MGLFKRLQKLLTPVGSTPLYIQEEPTPTQVLIDKIHHEFNSSGDRLIEEANRILGNLPEINREKTARLSKLGFNQVPELMTTQKIIKEQAQSQETLQLVLYYQGKYPNYKFIVEDQVAVICKKYNLVHGPIGNYKGFVPEKNLSEIEAFSVQDIDVQWEKLYIINSRSWNDWGNAHFYEVKQDIENKERCNKNFKQYDTYYRFRQSPFTICAPIKDMDITNMELDGYILKKHIPDPVILKAVNGGYLIVSSWGDEASDPIVVNNKLN